MDNSSWNSFGPGSFVAAPWNTCCQAPVFSELRFEGQGNLAFFVRTANDGSPLGRNASGPWSSWKKLNVEGITARIPSDHQDRQWIQIRCEMSDGAKLSQFSIHRQMILPDHPRLILTPQRVAETRQRIESDAETKRIYENFIVNFKRRVSFDAIRNNTNAFTYAAGDATKAFSSDKVSLFTRQFLHIRPGYIVIFDRVKSTDPAMEKCWLLHTIDEPTIDGRIARVSHKQGSLFCQTLLPIHSQTTKIGGPGKEFYVDGQNHPIEKQRGHFEPGAWRIEVQPTEANTVDCFLHFIHVADAEQQRAPQAALIDRADQYGLRVKLNDRELGVTFHKSGPVGGHIQINRSEVNPKTDQPLTTLVVPQRFDTEEI
ncbi:MAG: hypothetical protein R3C09_23490 [Pirellulaceae bacterium]